MEYSETLVKALELIEGHRLSDELEVVLIQFESMDPESVYTSDDGERLNPDIAAALYWLGTNWHGGQWCPLYTLTTGLDYSPGILANGPEPDSSESMLYDELEAIMREGVTS